MKISQTKKKKRTTLYKQEERMITHLSLETMQQGILEVSKEKERSTYNFL